MGGADEKSSLSRKDTSGTASRKSVTSERGLDQIISGTHLDDHSQYRGHHYHRDTEAIEDDDDSADGAYLTEQETEDTTDLEQNSSGEVIPEIRDGIVDDRDVEAGEKLGKTRTLKSRKSSKSIRDPNLVSWEGPGDPENPKNWTSKRKWAATLVGE
jgi:hypothetical protein